MQHYIRLYTTKPLSERASKAWFELAFELAPEGVVVDTTDNEQDEQESEYSCEVNESECDTCVVDDDDCQYAYDIELVRDLTEDEAELIVNAWDDIFKHDYQVEISNLYDDANNVNDNMDAFMDDTVKEHIENVARKFLHNRWVESQITEGWRYGFKFNEDEKVDPMLRNWDQLHESERQHAAMTKEEAFKFYVKYKELFK